MQNCFVLHRSKDSHASARTDNDCIFKTNAAIFHTTRLQAVWVDVSLAAAEPTCGSTGRPPLPTVLLLLGARNSFKTRLFMTFTVAQMSASMTPGGITLTKPKSCRSRQSNKHEGLKDKPLVVSDTGDTLARTPHS